ncbi:MAG: DEAD/DEAH box helicase, partial [Deltaproteobacteria bacterium]
MQDFLHLGLKDEILKMIDERGYEIPTPIQTKAIPVAMNGRDVMGQAQTGTGKTAAFGIPILNQIHKGRGLQALVLCPTRELAVQVCEEIGFLGRALDIHVLAVYGGQSIEVQFRALKKAPEIIIGTPGRLLDHMRRGTIELANLRFLVLDEADEMLDMGFLPDIEKVVEECPPERQTFLFSATLLEDIRGLAARFMVSPELVMVEPEVKTIALLQQRYYIVPSRQKIAGLCRILDLEQPKVSL